MSHLFEALQRSEAEKSGSTVPFPPLAATELLKAAERAVSGTDTVDLAGPDELPELDTFESLPVSLSPEVRLVSLSDRESLGSEKFRFLGVRLRQMRAAKPLKKVLITSTIAEEGKSLVSANLAVTLARKHQQRVLLIDGDLRRPVQAHQFGLGRLTGLSDWLKDDEGKVRQIYHLEAANLWLMPAGRPPENPLELMQSGRLADLLDKLTGWFDWIIIDSPPILPLADTSVWARFADGVLLVAREGKTEKRELQRGLKEMGRVNLLGVVFNSCTNTDHSNYYQRYGQGAQANGRNGNGSTK